MYDKCKILVHSGLSEMITYPMRVGFISDNPLWAKRLRLACMFSCRFKVKNNIDDFFI